MVDTGNIPVSSVRSAMFPRPQWRGLLHDGAENMLTRFGIDTKNLDVEKLRSDYNTLYSKKETLRKTCQSAEKDVTSLTRKLDKLNQYLHRTPAQQEPADRKLDKNQQSL